jgi:hypothetical protein
VKILIACETSARVRDEFRARGHEAVSCDLLPTKVPGPHIQGNVLEHLDDGWDMMIAHPPCPYLCSSGLHWNHRRPGRAEETEKALVFVRTLMNANIEKIAIENPIGCISTRIRKPSQIVQPYHFGDDASKATCFWLKNLPPLLPDAAPIAPRMVNGKPRWANQTDGGQNRLGPSPTRWAARSITYPGIARAMAKQWG